MSFLSTHEIASIVNLRGIQTTRKILQKNTHIDIQRALDEYLSTIVSIPSIRTLLHEYAKIDYDRSSELRSIHMNMTGVDIEHLIYDIKSTEDLTLIPAFTHRDITSLLLEHYDKYSNTIYQNHDPTIEYFITCVMYVNGCIYHDVRRTSANHIFDEAITNENMQYIDIEYIPFVWDNSSNESMLLDCGVDDFEGVLDFDSYYRNDPTPSHS